MDLRINRPTLNRPTQEENLALVDTWIADTVDKLNAFITTVNRDFYSTKEGADEMSAKIKTLEDEQGTSVYPVSTADAIFMPGSRATIYDEIMDLKGVNSTTTFNPDGSISMVLDGAKEGAPKKTVKTVFNADGSITETCTFNDDGALYYTKVTTFNDDGSITVTVKYEQEGV